MNPGREGFSLSALSLLVVDVDAGGVYLTGPIGKVENSGATADADISREGSIMPPPGLQVRSYP